MIKGAREIIEDALFVAQGNVSGADAIMDALEAGGVGIVPMQPTVGMFAALTSWAKDLPEESPVKLALAQWLLSSFQDDYKAMILAAPK